MKRWHSSQDAFSDEEPGLMPMTGMETGCEANSHLKMSLSLVKVSTGTAASHIAMKYIAKFGVSGIGGEVAGENGRSW